MTALRSIIPYLAYLAISVIGLTTRLRWRGQEHLDAARRIKGPVIYAFWHQRQLFFTWTHRRANASVLVSRSADGGLIAEIMRLSHMDSCRGSSSRGGAAATRDLLRCLAAGRDAAITVDGPKGPARKVKHGILFLAQETGLPIVPITNAVSHTLVFKRSWDRFQVPLPFSRAVAIHGPPVFVNPGDDFAAKALELEVALDRITDEADRAVAS